MDIFKTYILDQNDIINNKIDNLLSNDIQLVKLVGGKGLGLIKITKLLKESNLKNLNNIEVPYFKIITTNFFYDFIYNHIKEIIKEFKIQNFREFSKLEPRDLSEILDKAEYLKNYIKQIFFDNKEIKEIIDKAYIENKILAIRSSAISEDSLEKSYAGQMETFLNIKNYQDYFNSVFNCIVSIFSPKSINYKLQSNRDPFEDSIAVIVQEMIEPDISGVIFTFDPVNNTNNIVINSVFGLGEGLVSGKLNSDNYIVSKQKEILFKTYEDNNKPTLSDEQLLKLAEISLKIEEFYNNFMDIEFCIKDNKIYILQTRYITNIEISNYRVWDNSNIVESYPGITTPMTFSFIRKAYSSVYQQFCELMGLDRKTIFKNRYLFDSMLGFIYYRVYYNLLSWYELLSLLPLFNQNKEFMEDMMGVKQRLNINHKKNFYGILNSLKLYFKMFINFITLKQKIKKFLDNFYDVYNKYLNLKKTNKLNKMNTFELFEIYKELEEKILFNWKAPIINDLYVMISFGILKKINNIFKIDPNTHIKLLSKTGAIKTTLPIKKLLEITKQIITKNLTQTFIDTKNIIQLYKNKDNLELSPDLKDIFDKIDDYINEYGSRVIGELKLETKTLQEDPTYLFSLIKNYLIQDDKLNQNQNENKNNDSKETIGIDNELKLLRKKLGVFKYGIYLFFLKIAINTMKNREDQRLARTYAYSIVKDILNVISNRWVKKGILSNKDDIFFLEWDEIWDYAFGKSTIFNLNELIKLRKIEFDKYKDIELPDRFETFSEVYLSIKPSSVKVEGNVLRGVVACSGKVKAKVKVVDNLEQLEKLLNSLNGEILVAKFTDPGWTLLFPSISGLIIEKGSILSHTAIVAREMGIPTIVGVKNACSILKDNDIVELDAFSGTISIINQ